MKTFLRRIGVKLAVAVALAFTLTACEQKEANRPPPATLTADAVGHYCGMNLTEHSGPKGQIWLKSSKKPIWFSSVRDAVSFTMLPEEPKDVTAVYVSDMAKADNWDKPGSNNWVEAHDAFFVIGSSKRGGMGAAEAVPFSDKAAAEHFASMNGGKVVSFKDIPQTYILGSGDAPEQEPAKGAAEHGTHH